MEYEDTITIATPEGVDLELTLAGVGSRFTAAIIDWTIQVLLIVALLVLLVGIGNANAPGSGNFRTAAFVVLSFVVFMGYDIAFEVLASGRTPGKRWNGLRVVQVSGHPVTFVPSAIRNILRLIDILPGMYVVGTIAILVTGRNQRIGDLAGGTLVIRDRIAAAEPPPRRRYGFGVDGTMSEDLSGWDVGTVTAEELATVRHFLDRRYDLELTARNRLASQLAERLWPKVAGASNTLGPERFLEGLARAKEGRT